MGINFREYAIKVLSGTGIGSATWADLRSALIEEGHADIIQNVFPIGGNYVYKLPELPKFDEATCDLAVALHKFNCNSSHIDQCGWGYEIPDGKADWTQHAHKQYYKWAERLTKAIGLPAQSVIQILHALKETRYEEPR